MRDCHVSKHTVIRYFLDRFCSVNGIDPNTYRCIRNKLHRHCCQGRQGNRVSLISTDQVRRSIWGSLGKRSFGVCRTRRKAWQQKIQKTPPTPDICSIKFRHIGQPSPDSLVLLDQLANISAITSFSLVWRSPCCMAMGDR